MSDFKLVMSILSIRKWQKPNLNWLDTNNNNNKL